MAIIVEDGTGVADSNSYASVAFADNYHTARNNSAWTTANNSAKEAALVRATDYIDTAYGYLSTQISPTQSLAFPRVAFGQTVPQALVRATALIALDAITGTLNPTQDARVVTSAREKLEGVGETEYEYRDTAQARFPAIDAMLSPIVVKSGSGTVQAIRI